LVIFIEVLVVGVLVHNQGSITSSVQVSPFSGLLSSICTQQVALVIIW